VLIFNYTSVPKNGLFIYATDIESLIEQGNTAYDLGRSEEAVQDYDRALAIDPGEVDAQNNKESALLSLSSLAKLNQNTFATN
jgi:tetratricopeptide (TPR) repeat protein